MNIWYFELLIKQNSFPKIPNDQLSFVVYKKVLHLEVSVHNKVLLQKNQATQQLLEPVKYFLWL